MDFPQWRKHIDAVVADEGQWVGMLDENGVPMRDAGSIVSLSAPETRLATASLELVLAAGPGDPFVDELIAGGLGLQSATGTLLPAKGPTRMICVERVGRPRLPFTVTHSVVSGTAVPSQLTVHGVDTTDSLAWWPGVSIPMEWSNAKFSDWVTDASGTTYSKTRRLARVPFATKADGYTMRGQARTVIRNFIQDSLDAVNTLKGWTERPHMVVDFGGPADTSEELLLRTSDDYVWDTIAAPAKNFGLTVKVDLWWPGDPAVTVRTNRETGATATRTWPWPILIARVELMKEVA
ncbi:hypothetical protein ACEE90_03410 [Corynebacterium phoceense]